MNTNVLLTGMAAAAGQVTAAALAFRFQGRLRVTVIVKASFSYAHDAPMVRVAPQPIIADEVHNGGSPTRSTRWATDLVPHRNEADVTFVGSAHVRGVAEARIRLALLDEARALVDKRLLVRNPKGEPAIPVDYEHALGGIGHPENIYGVGAREGTAEPNIIDPARPHHTASFAPISAALPVRKRLIAGAPRDALRGPILSLSPAFDWGYFQEAPLDQRAPFLQGGEWLLLENLHPEQPELRARLPYSRGHARIYGLGAVAELPLVCDTLRVDGDAKVCTLSFRGSFAVASDEALGRVRVVAGVETPDAPIAWPDPSTLAAPTKPMTRRPTASGLPSLTGTMMEGDDPEGDAGDVQTAVKPIALPFLAGEVSPSVYASAPRHKPHNRLGDTVTGASEYPGASSATPFPISAPRSSRLPRLDITVSPATERLPDAPPSPAAEPEIARPAEPDASPLPPAQPPQEPTPKRPRHWDEPAAAEPAAPAAPRPRVTPVARPEAATRFKAGVYNRFESKS